MQLANISLNADQLLPCSVDAIKLCQQHGRVSGFLPLTRFQRLSQLLHLVEGKVIVNLCFGMDEQSRRIVRGSLEALIPLTCQRCLDRIDVFVSPEIILGLVWNDEQASNLPRNLEPVLMSTEELDLSELVEDELLLSLPLVAIHEANTCEQPKSLANEILADEVVEERINPFQVLANLKSEVKGAK
jgi:uncharacterized protein